MVAANKSLLREIRTLAIRDELLAMRLRGRLTDRAAGRGTSAEADGQGLTGNVLPPDKRRSVRQPRKPSTLIGHDADHFGPSAPRDALH